MAEHSKLPWRYDLDEDGADIVASDGRMVADMNSSRGHREANAALIVRAVNSHDALVKALSDLVTACNIYDESPAGTLNVARYIGAQERAAKLLAALASAQREQD